MYTERYEPRCGAVSDVAHTAIQMVNVAPTKAILSLSSLDREQWTQGMHTYHETYGRVWKNVVYRYFPSLICR